MHERTAKKQSTAAQPRTRCGTTRCAAPPVGTVELSWRRVTTTAGHGRVGSEVQRRCSAAGKHGTHREHGSNARTAAPHHRSNTDAGSQHGSSSAALHRRTACGGASVPLGASASVVGAPSTVRLLQPRRRTTSSCGRSATQCLYAAATPTNTDRSSAWLRGSAAQRRRVSASRQSTQLVAGCVRCLTALASACGNWPKCSGATPALPSATCPRHRT